MTAQQLRSILKKVAEKTDITIDSKKIKGLEKVFDEKNKTMSINIVGEEG